MTGDRTSRPATTGGSSGRPTIAETFSPRHNSLNFLRLVMCLTVIVSHAITLGGFGNEWIFDRTTLALPTLYGFFCLSGFLIAGSASNNGVGRYLWQRFLRIMPGYWVCLIVTAFFIGAVAWTQQPHPASCNLLSCYFFVSHTGPFGYLYHNWFLSTNQVNIAGTPFGGPVPFFWNNSVWTLLPEVFCYLLLAGFASLKILRHRRVVVALACGTWLVEIAFAWWGNANTVAYAFGPMTFTPSFLFGILTLTPVFLAGTVVYLYRDKIPDSGWLALGFTAVFAVGVCFPFFGQGMARFGHYLPSSTSVMAPALAYPLLWLGIHLPAPFKKVGARNDYSYGVYIYGWPVQQLLGIWGVQHWGYFVYMLSGIGGSMVLAVLSWHIVEKRALSLKKIDPKAMFAFATRRTSPRSQRVVPSEESGRAA